MVSSWKRFVPGTLCWGSQQSPTDTSQALDQRSFHCLAWELSITLLALILIPGTRFHSSVSARQSTNSCQINSLSFVGGRRMRPGTYDFGFCVFSFLSSQNPGNHKVPQQRCDINSLADFVGTFRHSRLTTHKSLFGAAVRVPTRLPGELIFVTPWGS